MRKKAIVIMLVMMGWAVTALDSLAAQGNALAPVVEVPDPSAGLPPQMVIAENEYHFSPVLEGEEIRYDFFVENKGRGELIIESVRPD